MYRCYPQQILPLLLFNCTKLVKISTELKVNEKKYVDPSFHDHPHVFRDTLAMATAFYVSF